MTCQVSTIAMRSNNIIIAYFISSIITVACAAPLISEQVQDSAEAKGILDGLTGTTTSAPAAGLPSAGGIIPGLGSNVANAGPMLIIGGFQAVVTKFDPSLIQGLPGLSGLPALPAAGK